MLQSSFSLRKIDSSCPQGNTSAKKEEKDAEKNKSTNSAFADTSRKKQSSST